MDRTFRRIGSAALLATLAGVAQAHNDEVAHAVMADFWSGLLHPFLGLDHLMAMLAVGMWAAVSSHRPWVAPLAFANMLLLGAFLAMGGYGIPMVEPLVAATLLALGLLVATRARMPELVAAALAGGFAVLHGMAHGSDIAAGASGSALVQALLGVVAGTAMLQSLGFFTGLMLRAYALWWTRAAGAGVALAGGALLVKMA